MLAWAMGLLVSTLLDLPSGPVIVWVLVAVALAFYPFTPKVGDQP